MYKVNAIRIEENLQRKIGLYIVVGGYEEIIDNKLVFVINCKQQEEIEDRLSLLLFTCATDIIEPIYTRCIISKIFLDIFSAVQKLRFP